jgi:hypothetical protein
VLPQAGLEEVAAPHGVAVLLETWTLADAAAMAAGSGRARRPPRTCAATRGCFAAEAAWWDEFSALVELEPGSAAPPPAPPIAAAPASEQEGSPKRRTAAPQPPCAACEARGAAAAGCGAAACARPLPSDVEERMQAAVARMLRGAGEVPERDGLAGTGAS